MYINKFVHTFFVIVKEWSPILSQQIKTIVFPRIYFGIPLFLGSSISVLWCYLAVKIRNQYRDEHAPYTENSTENYEFRLTLCLCCQLVRFRHVICSTKTSRPILIIISEEFQIAKLF